MKYKPNVSIYSRAEASKLIEKGAFKNCAVLSFYSPRKKKAPEEVRLDYGDTAARVFYIGVLDIDRECLVDYSLTFDTYLTEAFDAARFIYSAVEDGLDIVCQCDYGQSRSAACAAAILQHFEARGIDIFADYRYYPNQMVYHKIHDALTAVSAERAR